MCKVILDLILWCFHVFYLWRQTWFDRSDIFSFFFIFFDSLSQCLNFLLYIVPNWVLKAIKKIISYFKKSLKRFSVLFKRHCRNLKKPFVRNRVTEKHSILFLLYWIWHSDSNNTRNILFHMKQRCRIWFDIALNHTTPNCII